MFTKTLAMTGHALNILTGKQRWGPYTAIIKIYDRCNMCCAFCPTCKPYKEKQEGNNIITLEAFKKLVLELKQLKTQIVELSGTGEPFLHANIGQMIEHVNKSGLSCDVITNGTLLTVADMKKLTELNVRKLTISLNAGTELTYNSLQKEKKDGVFNSIKDNLKFLACYKRAINKNKPSVWISNVVCNKNCSELHDMIKLAQDVSADGIIFKRLLHCTPNFKEFELSELQKSTVLDKLERCSGLAKSIGLSTNLNSFSLQTRSVLPSHCYAWAFLVRINPCGSVNPCCDTNITGGNIKEKSFTEIWVSEAYKKFRKNYRNINILRQAGFNCEACSLYSSLAQDCNPRKFGLNKR
ncbi:MAG: radical SAM protein [Nanoarchaeota archaeon]|nr:radical SAM protein [Nanoarchaeota archaeon]